MAEFTDEHRAILDFERAWWKHAGAKEGAIRQRFGLTATRYYQLLNWIIDEPAALEHDPLGVRRLRRLRDRAPVVRTGPRLSEPCDSSSCNPPGAAPPPGAFAVPDTHNSDTVRISRGLRRPPGVDNDGGVDSRHP